MGSMLMRQVLAFIMWWLYGAPASWSRELIYFYPSGLKSIKFYEQYFGWFPWRSDSRHRWIFGVKFPCRSNHVVVLPEAEFELWQSWEQSMLRYVP